MLDVQQGLVHLFKQAHSTKPNQTLSLRAGYFPDGQNFDSG